MRAEAEKWYQEKFGELMERLDEGNLTPAGMEGEVKKLMGLANLRNLAVEWNHTAMEKLSQKDENEESLVLKGWGDKETYGKIFSEEFQREALERIANRQRNSKMKAKVPSNKNNYSII